MKPEKKCVEPRVKVRRPPEELEVQMTLDGG